MDEPLIALLGALGAALWEDMHHHSTPIPSDESSDYLALADQAERAWYVMKQWLNEFGSNYRREPRDEELEDLERAVGLQLLGHGISRFTFLFPTSRGDLVLKLDRYPAWANGNLREVYLWDQVQDAAWWRERLVPILVYDPKFRWLIMDRVEPPRALEFDELSRQHHRLIGDLLCIPEGITVCDTGERNLGVHEGRLKVLDYDTWYKQEFTRR